MENIAGAGFPIVTVDGADWPPWKNSLPEYCAMIECAPGDKELMVNCAAPDLSATVPKITFPWKKVTCPVIDVDCTGGFEATFTLSCTGVPDATLDGADSAIRVSSSTPKRADVLPGPKFLSPE